MKQSSEMKLELRRIRELAASAGIGGGLLSDEFLFSVLVTNLIFFNNEMTKADVSDGFVDGSRDGGIDFILSDENNLYLIQSKTNETITYELVFNSINKMKATLTDLREKKYKNFNDRLISSYLSNVDSFSQEYNVVLYFVSASSISKDIKNRIHAHFDSLEDDFLSIELIDGDEILEEIERYKYAQVTVKNGKLNLDRSKNYLLYDESLEGIICNVSASSLKELYNKEKSKGLFIYNLREHIPSAQVDSAIQKTINKERENFWFYNNGITIACEDYRIDGNIIKLENFSILNGAQTTTKIGNNDKINVANDFFLVAKIIKTSGTNQDDFMSKVSEASNSQKPIKFNDLKSNRIEQRILQERAMTNKPKDLAIRIKRGVMPSNHKKIEPTWKRIDNVKLAQLIYAFFYQSPGIAKNSPRILFQQPEYYKKIFTPDNKELDFDTLHDLVRLAYLYDEFKVDMTKNSVIDKNADMTKVSFARIGLYTIVAMMGYLIKLKREVVTDYNDSKVFDYNIEGNLFNEDLDDFNSIIFGTFDFLISQIIIPTYNEYRRELNITSELNLLKSDSYYQEKLLAKLDMEINSPFRIEYKVKIFNLFS